MKKLLLCCLVGAVLSGCTQSTNRELSNTVPTSQPSEAPSSAPRFKFDLQSINVTEQWQIYTNADYGFSFQYPKTYRVTINQDLSTEKYLYIDVLSADNEKVADLLLFAGGEQDLSPQQSQYQQKNALGTVTGSIAFKSGPSIASFREYVVLKNNTVYIVHWYGQEEKSAAEQKFASSFKFTP